MTPYLDEVTTCANGNTDMIGLYLVLPSIARSTQYKLEYAWGLQPGEFIYRSHENFIDVHLDFAQFIANKRCVLLPTPEMMIELGQFLKDTLKSETDKRKSLKEVFPLAEREYLLFPIGMEIPLYAEGCPIPYPHNATAGQIHASTLPRVKAFANPVCVAFNAANVLRTLPDSMGMPEEYRELLRLYVFSTFWPPDDFYKGFSKRELLYIHKQRFGDSPNPDDSPLTDEVKQQWQECPSCHGSDVEEDGAETVTERKSKPTRRKRRTARRRQKPEAAVRY